MKEKDFVVSYAQNREDVILAGFFTDIEKGFYVDIGAHHPVTHSVTKYFYDRGWRGINIEPNRRLFDLVAEARPGDKNVQVGIAEKPGELKLRIYDRGDGLSTFSDEMKEGYAKGSRGDTVEFHDEKIPMTTLKDLLDEQGVKRINFLKIDIEGFEYNALLGNDWSKYRPEVICIESNHIMKDWHPLLEKHGYHKVFYDGLNEYFVAREAKKRGDNFSYEHAIIGRRIISEEGSEALKQSERENESLDQQVRHLRIANRELDERLAWLDNHLREQLRFKNLLKHLAVAVDRVITRNISKITKKPHYYPKLQVETSEKSSQKMLTAIQAGDKEAFLGRPSLGWRIRMAFGAVAMACYRVVRKAIGRTLRFGLRVLRAIKRRIK